ncbi:MAG: cyclic nucleotide-binding domain-containing protein, partial [Myxococcales bacterium]
MQAAEIVRAFPLLRLLSPGELEALGAERVERTAAAPLFLQGAPGDAVYGILTGRLQIRKGAPGGGELCLELLGPG